MISYYGRLYGPLLGYNLGETLVDEMIKNMIEKNNDVISQCQVQLLKEFKQETSQLFKTHFNKIQKILSKVETLCAKKEREETKEKEKPKKKDKVK